MPVRKSAAAIYSQRLRNLAKARAAKKRAGGKRKRTHKRPRLHVRRASVVGYGRQRRGGFLPAIPASVLAGHAVLQQLKPITNLENFGRAIGIDGAVNRGLDKLGVVGKGIRGLADFGKKVLGYGKRRRHRKRVVGMGKKRRVNRRR
jgi:hypothetical protein